MESEIPKTAKGVIVTSEFKTSYTNYEIPQLKEKDLLIKIHSAPINPSDVQFIVGFYPAGKTFPTAAGFEGSGLVIATGEDPAAKDLLNKKVAFFASGKNSPGSWSEYTVINYTSAFPLPHGLDYESGAACLVNPLTVQGFIQLCKRKGYKSIVHSAAASSLGKMLVTGCQEEGITLVNIVRRKEQVDILKELGAEHIINTEEENWQEEAQTLMAELKVQAYFDPISGLMASTIIGLTPNGTATYSYGALDIENPLHIKPADMMFKQKTVAGYWLNKDMEDPELAMTLFENTWKCLSNGVFKTVVAAKFTHDQFEEALEFYKKNASKGKVLIQNGNF